jgi:uncharacterized protein YjbJ (UPF0337 family)
MNSDRVKGKTKELEGRVLRSVGKATGSKRTQMRGVLRQAEGKLQSTVGRAKEKANRVADRVRSETNERNAERGKIVRVRTTRTTTVRTKRG